MSSTFAVKDTSCQIERVNLDKNGNTIFCEYGGFLCASSDIKVRNKYFFHWYMKVFPTSYCLQQLSGSGDAFLRGHGLSRLDLDDGESVTMSFEQMIAFSKGTKFGMLLLHFLF